MALIERNNVIENALIQPTSQAAASGGGGYGPLLNAGAPTNGTTGAGTAAKGALLIDTTNAILYENTNTLASPTWTKVGTQT
jgi:hypothetical protein